MNERIEELRKQVDVDMHLHNLEDFRAMSGCFGLEGGNKIVDDYLDKFAELIVRECVQVCADRGKHHDGLYSAWADDCSKRIGKHFGVEK